MIDVGDLCTALIKIHVLKKPIFTENVNSYGSCGCVQLCGLMNKTNLRYMCLGLHLTTNQHHPVYCTGVVYVYGLASHMFSVADLMF